MKAIVLGGNCVDERDGNYQCCGRWTQAELDFFDLFCIVNRDRPKLKTHCIAVAIAIFTPQHLYTTCQIESGHTTAEK